MRPKTPISDPHSLSLEELRKALQVVTEKGLSDQEVARRLQRYGNNRLRETKSRHPLKILFQQIKSMVIIVLAFAGGAAFLFKHWAEGIAIGTVLAVNAAIGFFTELKAVRSMERLQASARDDIRVRREGRQRSIDAERLVPGDVVIVEAGDMVPADVRVLEANGLRVNESALTGESVPVNKSPEPVEKDAPLADRTSMLYTGTTITAGSGEGVVVGTGRHTELGHISELTQSAEKEATPLQQRLDRLGRRLAWLTISIAGFIGGAGLLVGQETTRMIETAIALGVAAIPEGLPIVATIALARGMVRMARRNALINSLPAVETLGATGMIFTDKTGTLTENRMFLQRVSTPGGEFTFDSPESDGEEDRLHANDPLVRRIIEMGVLCNNASLGEAGDNGDPQEEHGDPTEAALLRAGVALQMEREDLLRQKPEEREVAFNGGKMMMATFHRENGEFVVAVKGAADRVLEASTRLSTEDAGGERPMKDADRRRWLDREKELAGEGFRVLAAADKRVRSAGEDPYGELRFLGLMALLDPPREDVKTAIRQCHEAGVQVTMVTGDQPDTALSIARQTGLPDTAVMAGSALKRPDRMSEEDRRRVLETRVFARVSPAQKLHLIELMQGAGEIVAMTGDGVNDAPALKKADIGVAMGRRGTDAARQVADMVLKDDAFSSIVVAIRQGRIIFSNIRKSVMFMLCTNVAEVMAVAAAAFAGGFSTLPLPLLPLQILYLNVLTDVFPALAMGMGKGDPDVMNRPPRPSQEQVLTRAHWSAVIGWATLIAGCVLAALAAAFYGLGFPERRAITVSFLTLAFAKLWFVLNLRTPGTRMLENDIVQNPFIGGAILLCAALLVGAVYMPLLSDLLKTVSIGWRGWTLALSMSLIPTVTGQCIRVVQRMKMVP